MKKYRFFGGRLTAQADWLNRMADEGFRLVRTGKLAYEFETCEPGEYRYTVEFVGHKSAGSTAEYKRFLTDFGYTVWVKNVNLNYSVGHVRFRPWAEPGARLATNATTLNRELLIVEKKNDGRPFELHTEAADAIAILRPMRNAYLLLGATALLAGVVQTVWWSAAIFGGMAIGMLIPAVLYQREIFRLKRASRGME